MRVQEWICPEHCDVSEEPFPFVYPPSATQRELGVFSDKFAEPVNTWADGSTGVPDEVADNCRTGTDVPPDCVVCGSEAIRLPLPPKERRS